jgi:hypothetical protein
MLEMVATNSSIPAVGLSVNLFSFCVARRRSDGTERWDVVFVRHLIDADREGTLGELATGGVVVGEVIEELDQHFEYFGIIVEIEGFDVLSGLLEELLVSKVGLTVPVVLLTLKLPLKRVRKYSDCG